MMKHEPAPPSQASATPGRAKPRLRGDTVVLLAILAFVVADRPDLRLTLEPGSIIRPARPAIIVSGVAG
jgi:hypothetical protein